MFRKMLPINFVLSHVIVLLVEVVKLEVISAVAFRLTRVVAGEVQVDQEESKRWRAESD